MNYIWAFLIIFSVIFSLLGGGDMSQTASAVACGAKDALKLIFTIGSSIILWSGIMNIADKSGLVDIFAKMVSPFIKFIFPHAKTKEAKKAISMNMACNFLGLGNAATPFGIEAVKRLNINNEKSPNDSIVSFVVMNSASIQLVPATTIAILQANNAKNPFDIIICIWCASLISVAVGLTVSKILARFF